MTDMIMFILVWIQSSILAYLVFRADTRREFKKWTVSDRRTMVFLSSGGPISLFAALLVCGITACNNDTPAKW